VNYKDERLAVKLPKMVWLFRNIINNSIEVHDSTSGFFFTSYTENVKYNETDHLPLNSDLEKYKPYFNYSHKY